MKRILLTYAFLLLSTFILPVSGQEGPIGWASVNANGQNGTTGGAGGNVVTARNQTELITYCLDTQPLIIQIEGMITLSPKGRYVNVNSNKTIIGIGPGAGISQGGFRVTNGNKNVIFQNLTIQDTFVEGDWDGKEQDWDGIQITGSSHHIWVHKCTFLRQGDGALDIVNGADYITVSYCYFGANNKVSLISNNDNDTFTDRYRVTMHHNWFNETTQRNPRVRFGKVHLFNNYYYNMGGYGREMGYSNSNGYGIGIGVSAQIWSEHNFFEKCVNPSQFYDTQALPGYLIDNGSHFVQSGNILTRTSGINWDPADHYSYNLDPAEEVKAIVMANAGAQTSTTNVFAGIVAAKRPEMAAFPNPFSQFTKVAFMLPEAGIATIRLFDITGRQVREVAGGFHMAGQNEIVLNRDGLRKGIYLLTLEFKGTNITRKIAVF